LLVGIVVADVIEHHVYVTGTDFEVPWWVLPGRICRRRRCRRDCLSSSHPPPPPRAAPAADRPNRL